MWPFRRRPRVQPSGCLRIGAPRPDPDAYGVWTVGESRNPETFAALWGSASDVEVHEAVLRRWATLVPIHDPPFGVAEVAVEFDGRRAAYLRPPHLGEIARRIEAAGTATAEVPALIERSPAGATVRLLIDP
ncbi:MAG: hypothetical protein GC156_09470 [Actinomycetales bacterium]|nr:hypothetical protein [Actinomycetales bacterium]